MDKEKAGIGCPLFQKREPAVKKLTADINSARGGADKAELAGKLSEEAGTLLSCRDYESGNIDCKNCRILSFVRKKTADLIIRAGNLA